MARRTIVEIFIAARDATAAGMRGAFTRLDALRQRIFSLRTAFAAMSAFIVGRVVRDWINAFGKQEDAIIKLNTALRVTGRFTEEGSRRIQEMASEIQRLTTVADEAALEVSGTIAQLATQLTVEQLAEVQKAAVGLSQTFGLDLQGAAVLVGKALAGERDILSRYGISLDTTKTQQERFNELMRKTAGFFEVAAGTAGSLRGQFIQAANAFDDFKETVGEVIVEILGLDDKGRTLRDRIVEIDDALRENMGQWVKWGRVASQVIGTLTTTFLQFIRFLFNTGQMIGDALMLPVRGWTLLANLFIKLHNKLPGISGSEELKIGELPVPEDARDVLADLERDAIQANDALREIMGSWTKLLQEIQRPAATFRRRDRTQAGGGPDLPGRIGDAELEARDLVNQSALLIQQFETGAIGSEEFVRRLDELAPRLVALKFSGKELGAEMVPLLQALEQLKEKAVELRAAFEDPLPRTFGHALLNTIREATGAFGNMQQQLGELLGNELVQFAHAMTNAFSILFDGSEEAGAAFKAAMLDSISAVASALAEFYIGKAVGEIAEGIASFPKGMHHFAAAAKFTAAAALLSAIAGSIRGAATRAAPSGAGGASARTREAGGEGELGPATVIINAEGGAYDMNNPRNAEALAEAIQTLANRKIILVVENR